MRYGTSPTRWIATFAALALVSSGCAFITRASVSTTGGDANGGSHSVALSADGAWAAFVSDASNLIPHDGNRLPDVFVKDLVTGHMRRASVNFSGTGPDGQSSAPAISADGRFVAFLSVADNLVSGDSHASWDVFVRDMATKTTIPVSVDTAGTLAGADPVTPSISADGRYVAFATNTPLVADDGNGLRDVYIRDLRDDTTSRVSVDTAQGDANGASREPSLGTDGRFVAFESEADDLVAGDGNGFEDVFVRDRQLGTTTLVSVDAHGGGADRVSFNPAISADGQTVAFASTADDLVAGDGNGTEDSFVRDLATATTVRVSTDVDGGDADAPAYLPEISADGRSVVFESLADDLVPDDRNESFDVFVRDLDEGVTRRVSTDMIGGEANGDSGPASISADGNYVAFQSASTNLVAGAEGSLGDVYVRHVRTPRIDAVTPAVVAPGNSTTLHLTGSGFRIGDVVSASVFTPPGVVVTALTDVAPSAIDVTVVVDPVAAPGPRRVTVMDPGTGPGGLFAGYGLCDTCLTVSAPGTG